jgi:eukaryotic-like serine/threonine-protein kinase
MRVLILKSLALILLVVTGCNSTADQIAVPDVTGLNEAEAVQVLEMAGLTAAAAIAEGSAERAGTVIEQDPEPGNRVDEGSTVTLSVAREGF